MQPAYNIDKRKKIKKILLLSALSLTVLMIILLIAASIGGDEQTPEETKISADTTPTPYGTEVITPFYTNTPVPTPEYTPVPTAAPTPTLAPINMEATYKKGDSGDDIVAIQNMLNEIGMDAGDADGQYGDTLKSAVKNFQLYVGLSNDGIAGPSTLSALIDSWTDSFPKPLSEDPILYGITIGIDAGHQRERNQEQEPISPDSSKTRDKTPPSISGTWSGVNEYVINLQVALKLKQKLETLGAEVVMVRETNDVDISNVERAQMMNDAKVDFWIRIHTINSDGEEIKGMLAIIPADNCMDTEDVRVYEKNQKLAEKLLDNALSATGTNNRGIFKPADFPGFNWSQVPVCQIAVGYMTNESEERLLITKSYQAKIVDGLVNGILEYFNKN